MTSYADTGFLCSLYAPDAHSLRTVAWMRDQKLPLPVVWLHHLEFRNALRLRVFRREISPLQWDASLRAMLADLAGGALIQAAPALADLVTLKLSEDQPDPARGGTPRLQWTRRPRRVPLPARFRTA